MHDIHRYVNPATVSTGLTRDPSDPVETISRVLHLRLSAPGSDAASIGHELGALDGVTRLLISETAEQGAPVLSADVDAGAADELVAVLNRLGISEDRYLITRLDVVAPLPARGSRLSRAGAFAWIEVLGEARANSRPLARFLALMSVSGVVAAMGVVDSNAILIVGAMAVSPDLLPICATCVGIVGRRGRLARRSFATLLIGLVLVALVAMAVTALLDVTGVLPDDFRIGEGGLGSLADVDYSTVLVAPAAGVAAMLSFETRTAAAVGVAISVTTIPASAYLGVAFGAGEGAEGLGALLVLAVNISLLLVSGCLTLLVQRLAASRSQPAAEPT